MILKQPILKSGQLQKDRDETARMFIGPKLPAEAAAAAATSSVDAGAADVKRLVESPKAKCEGSWPQVSGGGPAEAAGCEPPVLLSDRPVGPKINYTKDELAKYGDLSMMSQAYAKINQVNTVLIFCEALSAGIRAWKENFILFRNVSDWNFVF